MRCVAPRNTQNNKKKIEKIILCFRRKNAIDSAKGQNPSQAKNGILINHAASIPRIKNTAAPVNTGTRSNLSKILFNTDFVSDELELMAAYAPDFFQVFNSPETSACVTKVNNSLGKLRAYSEKLG